MIKFVLLLVMCFPIYAVDLVSIKKNINDKREYQGIILSNGLKVLLISDPNLTKSAAAVDVQVGSFNEPDNRLGLAHFLEHMLDLGTQKYPESDSFANFISEHNGYYNAKTDYENTKYILSIDSNYLDEALDRFAQFFICPLFNQELINRERNAIESEYRLKIKDDNLRMIAAMAETSNPKHPFHRFGVGSIETLSEIKGQPSVRQSLVDFYDNYYSSDKMTLIVASSHKINQLQAMAIKYFNSVPMRENKNAQITELALDQEFAQDLVVKCLGEQRELSLLFKLNSLKDDYANKSMEFIIYLLEQTHKGSLKDYLWNNNWIIDYYVEDEHLTAAQDLLKITFKLSPLGEKNIEEITKLTLQYIKYLAEHEIELDYFNQLKNAKIRDANFRANESEIPLVEKYGRELHYLPMNEIVIADDFTDETNFVPEKIQELLAKLNPKNMRRIYMHKNAITKSMESWYKVGYTLTNYTSAQLHDWEQPAKLEFSNPGPNDLLPENFNIQAVSGNILIPGMILQSQQLQVWHKQDNRFKQPKVSLKFLLRGTNVEDSVEDILKANLTSYVIANNLHQYKSEFALAGVNYEITSDPQGLVLTIEMYSDKIKEVIEIITKAITNVEILDDNFEAYKDRIKCNLLNQRFEPLFSQALTSLFQVIHKPSWSAARKLAKINQITSIEVKEYWEKLITNTKVVALILGNITDVQAISIAKFFIAKIDPTPLEPGMYAAMPKLIEYQANDHYGLEFSAEHHDHAIASYIQTSEKGKIPSVKMLLINSMISSSLYEQLRSQEQLGYIVFSFPYIVQEHPGLIFVVESPVANPVMLNTRLNEFFKSYQNKIDDLTMAQFEQYKSSLKQELLEKSKSILEDANYYWSKLLDGTNDFNWKKELAAKLDTIKLQDMRNFYKNNLVTNQKSANVIAYTKINQKYIATDYIPLNEK
jgi:insulysin